MGDVTRAAIIDQTRQWVRENFLYMRPDWPLNEETLLLKGGVIDSVGVIELVAWLEQAFGVSIPEDEITERHFGTLGAIGDYIAGRCQVPQVGMAAWPLHVA